MLCKDKFYILKLWYKILSPIINNVRKRNLNNIYHPRRYSSNPILSFINLWNLEDCSFFTKHQYSHYNFLCSHLRILSFRNLYSSLSNNYDHIAKLSRSECQYGFGIKYFLYYSGPTYSYHINTPMESNGRFFCWSNWLLQLTGISFP